jgi:hypothetical protein
VNSLRRFRGAADVGNYQPVASARESLCNSVANAAGAAGNDEDFGLLRHFFSRAKSCE